MTYGSDAGLRPVQNLSVLIVPYRPEMPDLCDHIRAMSTFFHFYPPLCPSCRIGGGRRRVVTGLSSAAFPARILRITSATSRTKSFDNSAMICATVAPSTFRTPISFIRWWEVKITRPSRPRQLMTIAIQCSRQKKYMKKPDRDTAPARPPAFWRSSASSYRLQDRVRRA